MNSTETVTQQILGVQSLDFFQLFWQMSFRRVIAQNMLDHKPDLLRAEKDAALQMMDKVQLVICKCSLREDMPYITRLC